MMRRSKRNQEEKETGGVQFDPLEYLASKRESEMELKEGGIAAPKATTGTGKQKASADARADVVSAKTNAAANATDAGFSTRKQEAVTIDNSCWSSAKQC